MVPAAFVLLHIILPALRRITQLPPKPASPPATDPSAAVAGLILAALLGSGLGQAQAAAPSTSASNKASSEPSAALRRERPIAESVTQSIRIEEKFALATARLRWPAVKGKALPILSEPAVLTRIVYPTNALQLVQLTVDNRRTHHLLALEDGTFEIEFEFQLQTGLKEGEQGIAVPTHLGLVNPLTLTVTDLDVDVTAPQAVSIERETAGSNTVARLILPPVQNPWVGWKPRSRDVKREKAVFYAELFHLYAPAAGAIEGAHYVQVRPAQGEMSELIFDVPGGATVTDVLDPALVGAPADAKNERAPGASNSFVSVWRFDPDTRKLRVALNPPLSRPFTVLVRSQIATGPLPFEQSVGLLTLNQTAGQVGALAVATGPEVQLDDLTAAAFTPINLEDFPAATLQSLNAQVPGLTLRRAYRYADAQGTATATVKASPVQPDLRIEAQQTLSLGEDRTLLAANLNAVISRAGIFRISFPLPAGLDVESISGPALSHWTELKTADSRIVTLHLKGKTEGQTQFAISLTGPGTKPTNSWAAPRLLVREASKQSGQLVVAPEHGLRLQVATRDGLTQLDPQKSGIRQKGVLVFRIL
ncbi:MAG TPA: hypothetical protein VNM37_03165, partial [Candidatus Dormibacteraeota bacterium]|nr:hypothetical protein [Candidatus Dormibacteraeota bacterium]